MKTILYICAFMFFVSCGGSSPSNKQKIDNEKKEPPKEEPTKLSWYKPIKNASWQWQLQGEINREYDVEIYDIDLFDTNTSVMQDLKSNGKRVICYFSGGSYEDWRVDEADFPEVVRGKELDGWEGERWLDIRSDKLHSIMIARLDLAVQKGCDGVEPDNIDGYTNDTGFDLTSNDQLRYNKFIAEEAHKRGLSVGLKNDLDQIKDLVEYYDFGVNEQCHQYEECDMYKPFIDANKSVLNVEYAEIYVDNNNSQRDDLCTNSNNLGFYTLILPLLLDGSFRFSCK